MLPQEAACGALATFLEEGEPERHMAPYMAAILQTLAAALQVGATHIHGLALRSCLRIGLRLQQLLLHSMAWHGLVWHGM